MGPTFLYEMSTVLFSGKEKNFKKYEEDTVTDFGVGYDYKSIMHYSRKVFSANGKATIIPLASIHYQKKHAYLYSKVVESHVDGQLWLSSNLKRDAFLLPNGSFIVAQI